VLLLLTPPDAVARVVQALNAGADDCLVKPFSLSELLARLRALTPDLLADRNVTVRAGDLEVDTVARQARVRGTALALTMKELGILECLLRHPDQLIRAGLSSIELAEVAIVNSPYSRGRGDPWDCAIRPLEQWPHGGRRDLRRPQPHLGRWLERPVHQRPIIVLMGGDGTVFVADGQADRCSSMRSRWGTRRVRGGDVHLFDTLRAASNRENGGPPWPRSGVRRSRSW
jgi:hypothetical protein